MMQDAPDPQMVADARNLAHRLGRDLDSADHDYVHGEMTIGEYRRNRREILQAYMDGMARIVCRALVKQAVRRALDELGYANGSIA